MYSDVEEEDDNVEFNKIGEEEEWLFVFLLFLGDRLDVVVDFNILEDGMKWKDSGVEGGGRNSGVDGGGRKSGVGGGWKSGVGWVVSLLFNIWDWLKWLGEGGGSNCGVEGGWNSGVCGGKKFGVEGGWNSGVGGGWTTFKIGFSTPTLWLFKEVIFRVVVDDDNNDDVVVMVVVIVDWIDFLSNDITGAEFEEYLLFWWSSTSSYGYGSSKFTSSLSSFARLYLLLFW